MVHVKLADNLDLAPLVFYRPAQEADTDGKDWHHCRLRLDGKPNANQTQTKRNT